MNGLGGVRRQATSLLAGLVLCWSAVTLQQVPSVGAAGPPAQGPGDGKAASTAGASCWGIKQMYPSSTDGQYWLQTPALPVPEQFYCDMTTDGGGWVLIGRGREGWTFGTNGQGSATSVRTTSSGTAAFTPAALPSATIDGLLNKGSVKDLTDGIRVRRAANTAGTAWQDWRIKVATTQNWSWAFGGGLAVVNRTLVGTGTWAGGTTRDTYDFAFTGQQSAATGGLVGRNDGYRMFTWEWTGQGRKAGFTYGSQVGGGSTSATNYYYSATSGYAIPFAQVFVRPQIANPAAAFASIPPAGFAAEPKVAELKDAAELAPWGVSGLDHTNEPNMEPWDTPVMAVKAIGERVFVGGRFTTVKNGPAGQSVSQPYLAAFDRATGEWIPTILPKLNGRVRTMAATADGKLIIGGDFTTVNGDPKTSALAMLDPATGQLDPKWRVHITSASATKRPLVRAIAVDRGNVYVTGDFATVQGGTWGTIKRSGAVKVSATTGNPIQAWAPSLPATAQQITVSADGTRLYLGGYFTNISGDTNQGYFGWIDTTTGTSIPGLKPIVNTVINGSGVDPNGRYRGAAVEVGDKVVGGGSQHQLQLYSRSDRTFLRGHITRQGGDFQNAVVVGDKVYATCHCYDWDFQDTTDYQAASGYSKVEPINAIARYSAADLNHESSWYPAGLRSGNGEGIWTMDLDQAGCLWFGGDMVRRAFSGDAVTDWLGNFGRFCPADSAVPSAPAALKVTRDTNAKSVTLKWNGSSDDSGVVTYLVYRGDRIIASTPGTSFTEPLLPNTTGYTVRATDARGNLSASPAAATVPGLLADTTPPVVAVTSPASGSTIVPGSVTLTANASDDVGVARVEFRVDGVAVGSSIAAPFSTSWTATDGAHTIQAVATDAAANTTTSASVVLTVGAGALASESFTGTDGSPWSSAWKMAATAGSATLAAGAGQMSLDDTAGAAVQAQLTGVAPRADSSVLLSYRFTASTAAASLQVYLRGSGGWQNVYRPKSGYGVEVSSNSGAVTVRKNVNGTTSVIRTIAGGRAASTAKQWLRLKVSGSTIQVRTWIDGQAEPATWTSVDTDTQVTAAGQLFVSATRGTTNVGSKAVLIDDLVVEP